MEYQFSLLLIHHEADGNIVQQRASDGYINATALCKAVGKLFSDYRQNKSTQRFLNELSTDMGIPISELIQVVRGGFSENQGTWVHPQVAIHLAQWLSPKFAVKVSKWVYDWMSGKVAPVVEKKLPYHIKRHMLNQHKIPLTHFSILQEMTFTLLGPMEAIGYSLPEKLVPDVSQGLIFCDFLRKNGVDTSTFLTYKHRFPDGRIRDANLYPVELLPDFRKFIAEVWMPKKAMDYFKKRDPSALPYLDKILQLTYKPAA